MKPVEIETGSTLWLGRTAIIAAGAAILHSYTLFLPFVNQEGAFNRAAAYFRGGDISNIQAFFASEANTVVVPLLGASLSAILRVSPEFGCRLLALVCLGMVAVSYSLMLAQNTRRTSLVLLGIVLFNPLVWTFAGRGTADFTPMALAVSSIALFWHFGESVKAVIAASILFAIAALTKYHVVLLLPLVAMSPGYQNVKLRVTLFVMASAITALSLVIYNVTIFHSFGFWLTPPAFAAIHSPTPSNVGGNFVRYGGYLVLLTMPFSSALAFGNSSQKAVLLKMGAVGVAFALGIVVPSSGGEMNFGPFDRWVAEWLGNAVLSALFAVMLIGFSAANHTRIDRAFVLSILLFMFVLSFSRPAQRYLLLILPFYYLVIFRTIDTHRLRAPALALFLVLNALIAIVQMRGVPAEAKNTFGPARQF